MIPLEKAVELILKDVEPLGLEKVQTRNSYGRVLGNTVKVENGIPRFDTAAIDGYALSSKDTVSAKRNSHKAFRLVGDSKSGKLYTDEVNEGDVIKVAAGVRLPAGTDAVVKFEDVARIDTENVNVYVSLRPGQNVIQAGHELAAGESLMPKGRVLNSADVARLAEVGINEIEVFKKPNVGLISVGDEFLTESVDDGSPGVSRNQYISSLIKENSSDLHPIGACTDSVEQLQDLFTQALGCDLAVVVAGQSIDDYNFLKNAFRESKVDLKFWRVAIKPGKSVLFGLLDGKPVMGITGNMWAVAVIFDQLIKPLLARLSGLPDTQKLEVYARITKELRTNPTLTHIFKAIVRVENDGFTATPLLNNQMGELSTLSIANSFIIIPPEINMVKAGEKVMAEIFGPIAYSKQKIKVDRQKKEQHPVKKNVYTRHRTA